MTENHKNDQYDDASAKGSQSDASVEVSDTAEVAGTNEVAPDDFVEVEDVDPAESMESAEDNEPESPEDKVAHLQEEIDSLNSLLEKEKKEYMFLMAEFDNFRKRSLKEKSEIIKNGGEKVLKGLLPIVDDFERGLKASEGDADAASVREGMVLIYNKLKKYLEQNGVKEFDPDDTDFNPDRHEAISAVPVPDEALKGKILDTVEKGYMINDKVLRHAKVVVGQ